MPILDKEIIAPDVYHTADGLVTATPGRIRRWYRQGKKMLQKGLPIPVPWEHQEGAKPDRAAVRLANQAKLNAGHVRDYYLDRRGALWAQLDIPDPADAAQIAKCVRFVSPEIDDEWEDGDGQVWKDIITHVALTPRPVHYKQKPFGAKAERQLSQPRRGVVWLSLNQGRKFRRLAQRKRRRLSTTGGGTTMATTQATKGKTKGKSKAQKLSESEDKKTKTEEELQKEKADGDAGTEESEPEAHLSEEDGGADEGEESAEPAGAAEPANAEPDEAGLIEGIRQLLCDKMHLELPPDASKKTILRDLYVALHAHPGIDLTGGPDDDEDDLDDDEDGEQLGEDGHEQDGSDPNYGEGQNNMNAREELPVAAMSANVKKLSHRVQELEADNAALKADQELGRLAAYERQGRCSAAQAAKLRESIGKHRLSFARAKDRKVTELKARLDTIAEVPEGTFGEGKQKRLSAAQETKARTEWGRADGKTTGPLDPERAKAAAQEQLQNSGYGQP